MQKFIQLPDGQVMLTEVRAADESVNSRRLSGERTLNGVSEHAAQEEHDEGTDECGCWSCRPRFLQKAVNAKCLLFWLSLAAFAQGVLVNGLVNVVITTIERRYHLSSSETGVIASSYDIASLLCLLPVSYFGGHGNRSLCLAVGIALVGLGSLLFSMPHYLSGLYEASVSTSNLCSPSDVNSPTIIPACTSPLSRFRYFFIFGQLLHGAGSAPLYTLGVSYLDDSVKPKLSSVYVGIYYACSMLGPACGFLLGGQFLRIYIDFTTASSWSVTEHSPAWLGAWWIGFVIVGVLAILISIPLFMFPSHLPNSAVYKAQRTVETHDDIVNSEVAHSGFEGNIRDFPKAVKYLLKNLTFVLLNLAAASDSFVVMGAASFGPKVLQSQFGYSASTAAMIMGVATIPMGAGGTLLGGYLVKRYKMTCAGIIKFCLVCSVCGLLCSSVFLIRCPDPRFAGVNTRLNENSTTISMVGPCNIHCNCREDQYDPVCSTAQNVIYLTPCHAGCVANADSSSDRLDQGFASCSCIGQSTNPAAPVATRSSCVTKSCSGLNYVFILVFAVLILFTFLSTIPGVTATLRCVAEPQRPFAMGVQWVIVRLLGSVPGPLTFGIAIDTVCTYWQSEPCRSNALGRCLSYSNAGMSNAMFAIAVTGKALTMIFFVFAWRLYKPPGSAKQQDSSVVAQLTVSTPALSTSDGD